MTRRTPLLLATLVLALAAVYALVQPSWPTQEPVTAPRRPLSCRLSAGEELAFHVRATSSARADETESPQQLSLEATLWWRVLEERSSGGWVVAATLADVQLLEGGAAVADASRRAALETPFLLQVDRDCRFRDFAFDPATGAEARRQLQGTLKAAELVLAPLPRTQWVSRHRDSLGAFDASYTLEASDDDDDAPSLTRRRGRYISSSLPLLPPQMGGRVRVDVLASELHATLDARGRWVSQLDGSEHLRAWMGQKLLSEVRATVRVERLDGAQRAPASMALLDSARFAWGQAGGSAGDSPRLPPPPEPALASLSLDEALADFAARLGQGPNGLHGATERLASYLSVHPEAIPSLLARMREGALPEQLHAALFLALEKTGTLAAESGLGEALSDRRLGTMNRMRAAAALQDIPRPSERTAATLIQQARASRADAEERQVADAALLALGALSQRVETTQPEVARMAHGELELRLGGAREPEDVAVALAAVGNSGDEAFASALESYKNDPSPLVRAHAARAWRRMEPDTLEPVLTDWLAQESDPRVRRAIADALAENVREAGRPASPAVLAAAAARLASEPDVQTRAALIALLGSSAATDASARLALVQHFHRETVPDLQVLIGRFVRAEELR